MTVTSPPAPAEENQSSWADQFLEGLHDTPTPNSEQAVEGWEGGEGGAGPEWGIATNTAAYNPINTTLGEPGSSTVIGGPAAAAGVQSYTSWAQGLTASVSTLNEDQPGYAQIRQDLASGAAPGQLNADVDASAWGTHDLSAGGYQPLTGPGTPPVTGVTAVSPIDTGPGGAGTLPASTPAATTGVVSDVGGDLFSLLGGSSVETSLTKAGIVIVAVVAGAALLVAGVYKAVSPGAKAAAGAIPEPINQLGKLGGDAGGGAPEELMAA
jgi:hypothetical protein